LRDGAIVIFCFLFLNHPLVLGSLSPFHPEFRHRVLLLESIGSAHKSLWTCLLIELHWPVPGVLKCLQSFTPMHNCRTHVQPQKKVQINARLRGKYTKKQYYKRIWHVRLFVICIFNIIYIIWIATEFKIGQSSIISLSLYDTLQNRSNITNVDVYLIFFLIYRILKI